MAVGQEGAESAHPLGWSTGTPCCLGQQTLLSRPGEEYSTVAHMTPKSQ